MNNIIIHFGSRVTVSAAHDLAIALAAQWYRKFTPWWVDGAEEEGLLPIDEADEPGEEVEEGSLEDEKEVDFAGEVDIFTDVDLHNGENASNENEQRVKGGKDREEEASNVTSNPYWSPRASILENGALDATFNLDPVSHGPTSSAEGKVHSPITDFMLSELVTFKGGRRNVRRYKCISNMKVVSLRIIDEDGDFVAIDPDVDDEGWDADDEESDGDDDEERGLNQRDVVDSGHSSDEPREVERHGEAGLHSSLSNTRARDSIWKDNVTDCRLRHDGDSLDHASAFEELLCWNPWTGPWESSDQRRLNDDAVPCASDGLYGVTGLGLTVEGCDILQFREDQAIQTAGNDDKPIDHRALETSASPWVFPEMMPKNETNTSWPVEPLQQEAWVTGMIGLGLMF